MTCSDAQKQRSKHLSEQSRIAPVISEIPITSFSPVDIISPAYEQTQGSQVPTSTVQLTNIICYIALLFNGCNSYVYHYTYSNEAKTPLHCKKAILNLICLLFFLSFFFFLQTTKNVVGWQCVGVQSVTFPGLW